VINIILTHEYRLKKAAVCRMALFIGTIEKLNVGWGSRGSKKNFSMSKLHESFLA
jgi:hypothetical protein